MRLVDAQLACERRRVLRRRLQRWIGEPLWIPRQLRCRHRDRILHLRTYDDMRLAYCRDAERLDRPL